MFLSHKVHFFLCDGSKQLNFIDIHNITCYYYICSLQRLFKLKIKNVLENGDSEIHSCNTDPSSLFGYR